MAGAAVLSLGMVTTFALPAYATPDTEGQPDFTPAQQLVTAESVDVPESLTPLSSSDADAVAAEAAAEAEAKAEAERQAQALADQAEESAAAPAAEQGADVPAGAGAQGIVNAAQAQLGQMQDCTALVERSLRAIGIPAGDLGTQVGEYTALGGTLVSGGSYAPGDILIWSGRHVAVYIGNGQAVHGGYGGNQTVIAGAFIDGPPSGVVRF